MTIRPNAKRPQRFALEIRALLQLQKRRGLWKATSVLGLATAQWPVSLEVAVDGHIGMPPGLVKGERRRVSLAFTVGREISKSDVLHIVFRYY